MGQIQSTIGLVSGIPIQDTVDQLIAISAQPRDLLAQRNQAIEAERLAVAQLSSLVLAFQFEVESLSANDLFDSREVNSSDPDSLGVSLASGGSPAAASYEFTPVQTASNQHFISQAFAADATLSGGTLSFNFDGFLDRGISLDKLNAGTGVQRGEIRITDRSGATDTIDLRFARSVDDVLDAINGNKTVSVSAVAEGDSFRLTDETSGGGSLIVTEVGSGTTAADLGLSGINTTAASALGNDVFTLHGDTELSFLNDQTGVQIREGNDLQITLADESILEIDLSGSTTLGDVLDVFNAADPAKLSAALAADGNRIELTDLTSGAGSLTVASVDGGTAAADLGLDGTASGATLAGGRLVAGIRGTLLKSLNGGTGIGTQGSISVTDRSGSADTADISSAETIGDFLDAINGLAVSIEANINESRTGIVITDVSGSTSNDLVIADATGDAAQSLGIVVSDAVSQLDSGSIQRQSVSAATLLSSLNGGEGIDLGDFYVTDSAGSKQAVDLNTPGSEAQTVGDVINRINALSIEVVAQINDTGDGILILDQADGSGVLTVEEVGNGTTAADLGLLGTAVDNKIDGTAQAITIQDGDTLADVVTRVNELAAGVTATIFNDGAGQRLSLTVDETGTDNEISISAGATTLSFEEVSPARDALLLFGSPALAGGGILLESSTNEFSDVVAGIDLTVQDGTLETVTIDVTNTSTPAQEAVSELVDAYNSIRANLDDVTSFNEEDLTTGILFGTNAALRVDTDLSRVLGSRFFGVGVFDSLEEVGLSLNEDGRLEFDTSQFDEALATDPDGVAQLFTDDVRGVAARLTTAIDQLAGDTGSLLDTRSQTLSRIADNNAERIGQLDEQLSRQRDRLLLEFFRLEETIAGLQQNLAALSALQIIPPLTSSSGLGVTS